ncbi:MAG: hypothetical protein QF405_07170 [Roseibacillus sp.]|jgi:hypothetical protein|nr:hypothetical protein [Roseibacillus sp.]MCP4730834.1 hypothetical protein [Roseibacillus sp.]MDP7106919.1 hypothetical protein [Roseibacillus sp.]MDP7307408.1 hypothetical protein [Roseibacillus sp.]HJM63563.1 hypothetical protein [Roseibacillus sp.]|tara:strand:+ start:10397 stop:10999 length:603 start_codon:yes stop_codon:yes gene_type:complete
MTRRSLGFIFLGLGLASLAGGLLLFFSGIFTIADTLSPVARITSPGEVPVRIDEAGVYTLWHDRKVQAGASSWFEASHWEVVPVDMSFSLIRVSDRKEFPAIIATMHSSISTPDRESFGIGTFEPDREGAYLLKATSTMDLNHEFSLTKGKFTRTLTGIGLRLILTCLLGFFGVVLLALGLIFVLMKKKPTPLRLSPSAL